MQITSQYIQNIYYQIEASRGRRCMEQMEGVFRIAWASFAVNSYIMSFMSQPYIKNYASHQFQQGLDLLFPPQVPERSENKEDNSSISIEGSVLEPAAQPSSRKEHPLSRRLRALNNTDCKGNLLGIYITTNEQRGKEVTRMLDQMPRLIKSCHIGFSGWHNFDIMVARRSTYGLVCDFNPSNKVFIEKTLEVLTTSSTRKVFVERVDHLIIEMLQDWRENKCLFSVNVGTTSVLDEREQIYHELTREGSWLSSEASFGYIKALAMKDQIAAITIDICDTERFKKIAKIFQDNFIEVDSLYLSNICHYMCKEEAKKAYASTVHTLIQPDTIVIHCPSPSRQERVTFDGSPIQKVHLGKIFQLPKDDPYLFDDPLKIKEDEELKEIFQSNSILSSLLVREIKEG